MFYGADITGNYLFVIEGDQSYRYLLGRLGAGKVITGTHVFSSVADPDPGGKKA